MISLCLAIYLDLGLGYDRHIDEGTNPQSIIRLSCQVADDWHVEYSHHSSVRNGFPFNNKPEDLTDQLSVVYRFKLK